VYCIRYVFCVSDFTLLYMILHLCHWCRYCPCYCCWFLPNWHGLLGQKNSSYLGCFHTDILGISIDVVLIEPSLFQRWILFLLNLASILLAFRMQKELKGNAGRYEVYYFWLLNLYVCLHILALVTNFAGRVTLAKLFSSSAVISVSFALAIDVWESLIFEIIYLHLEAFKDSKISVMFNFEEIKKNFQSTLRLILLFIWVMIFCFL